jgi:hypothetical protein
VCGVTIECHESVAIDATANLVDRINPEHYREHPSGVECIIVARHMSFCLGNALKYIWRAGRKGDAVEDLKKAVWYLKDEIGRLEAERRRVAP